MVTGNPVQNMANKRKVHTLLSAAITLVGLLLMIYMIVWEDEPGAVPLLLIAVGIGWFVVTRVRMRPPHA